MDDLRVRFRNLGWRPMPDDWGDVVRRAEGLAGAAEPVGLGAPPRVRRVVRPDAARTPPWLGPRLNPTTRLILVFALLAGVLAGTVAFGALYRDWLAVTPPSHPPSAPPFITVVQPCPGVRSTQDLVDTHTAGNDFRSWLPGAPVGSASGSITAVRMDALLSVGVFSVDVATGVPCRLVHLGGVELLPLELRWSPDGGSVAVLNQLWAGSGETHLLVWSGGDEPTASTLTRPWIGSETPGLAWSPDSATIALAASRTVTFISADGSVPRVVACEPCRAATRIAWSPDGATLAMRTPSPGGPIGTTEINLVAVADGTLRRLDVGSDRLDLITWLDAGTLLVIDHAADRVLEVPIDRPSDFATRELVRLDDGAAYIVSPDLMRAAFVAGAQRTDERLVVVDLVDNTRTTLARSADLDERLPIGHVVWSPDGRTLAFSQVGSGEELPVATAIWLVDSDGSGLRQLVRGPFDLLDGRSIGSGLDSGTWRPGSP